MLSLQLRSSLSRLLLRRPTVLRAAAAGTPRYSFSTEPAQQQQHEHESFLTGTGAIYAEQMYEQWQADPSSVEESWRHYFDNLQAGNRYSEEYYSKPTAVVGKTAATAVSTTTGAPSDSLAVAHLIRAYQVNGHTAAKLDPLDTFSPETFPYRPKPIEDGYPESLTLEHYGFTNADLDRKLNFRGTSAGGNKGYLQELANSPNKVTLRQILAELRKTYCGTVGVEYMVRACE